MSQPIDADKMTWAIFDDTGQVRSEMRSGEALTALLANAQEGTDVHLVSQDGEFEVTIARV